MWPHWDMDSEFFNAASLTSPKSALDHCKLSVPLTLKTPSLQGGCVFFWMYVAPRSHFESQGPKDLIIFPGHIFLDHQNYRTRCSRSSLAFCPPLLRKTPINFCLLFPSCIKQNHRQKNTGKRGRVQLCSHVFSSLLAQSLERSHIELPFWMQTLGVVLGTLEIQWPVFVYRADLEGRGVGIQCVHMAKGKEPFFHL